MTLRPIDSSGNILPVLTGEELLTDAAAVGQLAVYRLHLMKGDWWENPEEGCRVLKILGEDEYLGEEKADALQEAVTEVLRTTPGVTGVEDIIVSRSGEQWRCSCRLTTIYDEDAVVDEQL